MTAPTPLDVANGITGPASTEIDEHTDPGTPVTPDVNKSLAEANARYLRERDEAREAVAAAETRLSQLQRNEIERLAAERLSHPADVFTLSGNDVVDYLDENGNVDPYKVAADVGAIIAERPGMSKHARAYDPSQGAWSEPSTVPAEPAFVDLFHGTGGTRVGRRITG
ncbi:hypothetical protein QN239_25690 [Mycolicibacterium sp. Y3]